jgi:hypothetical protein
MTTEQIGENAIATILAYFAGLGYEATQAASGFFVKKDAANIAFSVNRKGDLLIHGTAKTETEKAILAAIDNAKPFLIFCIKTHRELA